MWESSSQILLFIKVRQHCFVVWINLRCYTSVYYIPLNRRDSVFYVEINLYISQLSKFDNNKPFAVTLMTQLSTRSVNNKHCNII